MPPSTPFDQGRYSDPDLSYLYDRPRTPQANTMHHRNSISGPANSYQPQQSYHPPYEPVPTPYPPQSTLRPRINIPATSSGFMPLQSHSASSFSLPSHPSESTGFVPLQNHSSFTSLPSHGSQLSETAGFTPPPSQTPVPLNYHPSQYNHHAGFAPAPAPTPAPTTYAPSLPPSSSTPFQQPQSFIPSSSFHLSQYSTPPPTNMVAPQYVTAQSPGSSQLPLTGSQQMQPMYSAATPPPHEFAPSQAQAIAPQNSLSSSTGPGSRPLPYPQHVQHQAAPPILSPLNSQTQLPYNRVSTPLPATAAYQAVSPPPPPPPPLLQMNSLPGANSHQLSSHTHQQQPNAILAIPPPPPPPLLTSNSSLSRRPALPQPPFGQQQAVLQPVPPPPPPPPSLSQSNPLPPPPPHLRNVSQTYYPAAPQQMSNHAPW